MELKEYFLTEMEREVDRSRRALHVRRLKRLPKSI